MVRSKNSCAWQFVFTQVTSELSITVSRHIFWTNRFWDSAMYQNSLINLWLSLRFCSFIIKFAFLSSKTFCYCRFRSWRPTELNYYDRNRFSFYVGIQAPGHPKIHQFKFINHFSMERNGKLNRSIFHTNTQINLYRMISHWNVLFDLMWIIWIKSIKIASLSGWFFFSSPNGYIFIQHVLFLLCITNLIQMIII